MNTTSKQKLVRRTLKGLAILVVLCLANIGVALKRPESVQEAWLMPQDKQSQGDPAPGVELPATPKVRLVKSPWRATPILEVEDEGKTLAMSPR